MAATDAELVAQAISGSDQAFRELLLRYQRPVFNLIVRMVGDAATAEDLAQDTFVKAFSRLGTYDPTFKFANWIFKIAHNTAIDHLRRRKPSTVSLNEAEQGERVVNAAVALADSTAQSPERAAERAELAASLERGLERLRADYRQAIVLRYHEGLAYEEIAEIMDLPLGTVKSDLHRARKELAAYLTEAGWAPDGKAKS